MNNTTPKFPFVDVRARLKPDRLARHMETDCRVRQAPLRETVIRETAGWLFRAQDAAAGTGVAEFHHLQTGWSLPSAETTVAVIPTFLSLDQQYSNAEALARAIRLGIPQYVVPSLADSLSATTPRPGRIPTLAQAILAWVALDEHTHDRRFRSAAVDTTRQLIEQEPEAIRRQVTTISYQALSAWALLRAAASSPSEPLTVLASSCAQSVAAAIGPDGYLHESFRPETFDPLLLRTTQTFHALLETGVLSGTRPWIDAARRGAQRLIVLYSGDSTSPGRYPVGWRANHSFNCMAGMAQTAVLWLRLAQQGLGDHFLDAAVHLDRFIASTIDTTNPDPGIRGGVRAGYPLWVDYHPLAYRALAAKFALDAFLLEDELTGSHHLTHKLQFKRPAEPETPAHTVGGAL